MAKIRKKDEKPLQIQEIKELTRNTSAVADKITTARSSMTELELKAFYLLTTLLKMEDKEFYEYKIHISEFCNILNIKNTHRSYIKNVCKKLLDKAFYAEIDFKNERWRLEKINIFRMFEYDDKTQIMSIAFSADIEPYLLELKEKGNFTKIDNVRYIINLNSKYAIRIYALLKDYQIAKGFKHRDINIDALARMLQLPKGYTKSFGIINQKVLEVAKREINEFSDIKITDIERIRKAGSKKIESVRIHFEKREIELPNETKAKSKFLAKLENSRQEKEIIRNILTELCNNREQLRNFTLKETDIFNNITKTKYNEPKLFHFELLDTKEIVLYIDFLDENKMIKQTGIKVKNYKEFINLLKPAKRITIDEKIENQKNLV